MLGRSDEPVGIGTTSPPSDYFILRAAMSGEPTCNTVYDLLVPKVRCCNEMTHSTASRTTPVGGLVTMVEVQDFPQFFV